jgi:hypothetical protein
MHNPGTPFHKSVFKVHLSLDVSQGPNTTLVDPIQLGAINWCLRAVDFKQLSDCIACTYFFLEHLLIDFLWLNQAVIEYMPTRFLFSGHWYKFPGTCKCWVCPISIE